MMTRNQYDEYGFDPYSNGAVIWEPGEKCWRVIWYGRSGERLTNTLPEARSLLEADGGKNLKGVMTVYKEYAQRT
jgi:hypothetical protein